MMTLSQPFLLYGSYGYTGTLIADLALQHGLQPILSGRDTSRLAMQAGQLDLKYRTLTLDDPKALDVAVREVPLVLNCAGPFSQTFQPIAEACLRAKRHYLDITGEIPVFEALAARDQNAREAGVMLLPGVGFDVVPSDCLASHLKRRLADATHLTIAIQGLSGGSSRGTMLTSVEHLAEGGVIRRDGRLTRVPLLGKVKPFDFGHGPRSALNIPWGDVSTAYYSTGIPNIETYMVFPTRMLKMVPILRSFVRLASSPFIKWLLRWRVQQSPPGPTEEQRRTGISRLIGIASNAVGKQVISKLETPNGYLLTALTSVAIVERVLRGELTPGFQTPAMAYGPDFIMEFEGVKRVDF